MNLLAKGKSGNKEQILQNISYINSYDAYPNSMQVYEQLKLSPAGESFIDSFVTTYKL